MKEHMPFGIRLHACDAAELAAVKMVDQCEDSVPGFGLYTAAKRFHQRRLIGRQPLSVSLQCRD